MNTIYATILFLLELLYLKVADKYNIIDKPNERSSHKRLVIRGGGVVFVLGFVMWSVVNAFPYPYLLLGLMLSAAVSFIDDVRGLPNKLRFAVHVISVALLLQELDLLQATWWILPLFIVLIGIKNAYNFMDGINGITGFYSLAVLIPFYLTEPDAQLQSLILVIGISLAVFLFFNARTKALCFAGDIGSISMALLVLFVVLERINITGNFAYIFVLLLYGIDSIFTIVQRLWQRENIFAAHRKHFYQLLVNEYKFPHLPISILYGVLQLLFNVWVFYAEPSLALVCSAAVSIGLMYIAVKFKLLQKLKA